MNTDIQKETQPVADSRAVEIQITKVELAPAKQKMSERIREIRKRYEAKKKANRQPEQPKRAGHPRHEKDWWQETEETVRIVPTEEMDALRADILSAREDCIVILAEVIGHLNSANQPNLDDDVLFKLVEELRDVTTEKKFYERAYREAEEKERARVFALKRAQILGRTESSGNIAPEERREMAMHARKPGKAVSITAHKEAAEKERNLSNQRKAAKKAIAEMISYINDRFGIVIGADGCTIDRSELLSDEERKDFPRLKRALTRIYLSDYPLNELARSYNTGQISDEEYADIESAVKDEMAVLERKGKNGMRPVSRKSVEAERNSAVVEILLRLRKENGGTKAKVFESVISAPDPFQALDDALSDPATPIDGEDWQEWKKALEVKQ